jgi:hypothetical protein
MNISELKINYVPNQVCFFLAQKQYLLIHTGGADKVG